jgi:hypothetical protein
MPVRKIPSKVPAPPMEATGAPKPCTPPRLSRSAPMSVPRLPLTEGQVVELARVGWHVGEASNGVGVADVTP